MKFCIFYARFSKNANLAKRYYIHGRIVYDGRMVLFYARFNIDTNLAKRYYILTYWNGIRSLQKVFHIHLFVF